MATSENLIPIPGRLHSVATEKHVAGADEIYDDDLQKLQSTINAEVDEKLDDAAYIAADSGSAVIPSFDPQADSLWKAAQVLSAAEKAQVKQNIGIAVPDEEDLTVLDNQIKFKDKTYSSTSYSGLGKVYLRKNMVNGVNTLTQSMINQANTIYIIQYDYVLGEDITVPVNCILEFDGGSLKNGTITLSSNNKIINGILFHIHLEAVANSENIQILNTSFDDEPRIKNETNYIIFKNVTGILLKDVSLANWRGRYTTEGPDADYDFEHSALTFIKDSNNVVFDNVRVNKIIPEGIIFYTTDNITVRDCSIDLSEKPLGVNYPGWTPLHCYFCNNVIVNNCYLSTGSNCSIANLTVNNLYVNDCLCVGGRGIDIGDEQYPDYGVVTQFNRNDNIIVNCTFKAKYGVVQTNEYGLSINNIVINNCIVEHTEASTSFTFSNISNSLTIKGCKSSGCNRFSYVDSDNDIVNIEVNNNDVALVDSIAQDTDVRLMVFASEGNFSIKNVVISNNNFTYGQIVSDSTYNTLLLLTKTYIDAKSINISNNTITTFAKLLRLVGDNGVTSSEGIVSFKNNIINSRFEGTASSLIFDEYTKFRTLINNNTFINTGIKFLSYSTETAIDSNLFKTAFVSNTELPITFMISGNSVDNIVISRNIGLGTVNFDAAKDVRITIGAGFVYYNNNFKLVPGKYDANEYQRLLSDHTFFSVNNLPSKNAVVNNNYSSPTKLFWDADYNETWGKLGFIFGSRKIGVDGFVLGPKKGTTSNRPTGLYGSTGILESPRDIGYEYFDTDLGKPVYAKTISGSTVTWVDATGATV